MGFTRPVSTQYAFGNFISPSSSLSPYEGIVHAQHVKGGYQKVFTIEERNALPIWGEAPAPVTHIGFTVSNDGGYTTGIRSVGMLVYVIEENKFYVLIPKGYWGNNGILSDAEWLAEPQWVRAGLLKPNSTQIYTNVIGGPPTFLPQLYTPSSTNGNDPWVEVVFSSETTSDIVADLAVGGVNLGQTVPAGTNIQELAELLLTKVFYPTYTIPSISITGTYSGVLEVGTVINQALTLNGYENDSGPFTELNILQNSSVISTSSSLTGITIADIASQFGYVDPNNPNKRYELTHTDNGRSILLGNNSWSGNGSYSAGLVKKDNKGINDVRAASVRSTNAPQAAATGFASNTISVNGQYRQFYGNVNSFPTTSSEVRALPNLNFASLNTFATPTLTTTKFTLAIPATKNLVSAVTENNQTVTDQFILSTTLTQVADAGGNLVNYKVYNFSTATPFNVFINITLS